MNEIEQLRRLRADLPPARPEKRAAARAALTTRIDGTGRPARPRATRLWRPRLALAVAGVALAALLVALPIGILGGSGKVEPAVARVLHQAAEVAAAQEPVGPGRGQFLYTRSKDAYLRAVAYSPGCGRSCDASETWSLLVPSMRESWISFDDSLRGRVRTVSGKPRFVSADQRAGWVAAGSPAVSRPGRVEDSAVSGSGMHFDPAELPTDPAELREMLEAREIPGISGPPGEAETFVLIGDMLRETYLPSAIRAAIYELTAELPGVELLGEVRDPVGRPGVGIAYTDERRVTRHELIFDSTTSALLGERDTLTRSGARSGAYGFEAPPGTMVGYAAYLESRVVDSVGERAPAGAGKLDMSIGCYERASLLAGSSVLHDPNPIAACAKLWREGAIDTTLRRREREGRIEPRPSRYPRLVACAHEGSSVAHVFPGSGTVVCRRLGLVPWRDW